MRKIRTQEEIERSKKVKKTAIGIIFIGIMILSTIGFSFFNRDGNNRQKETKINYHGFDFVNRGNGLWATSVSGQEFSTLHNPQETENISVNFNLALEQLYGKPLYFVVSNENAANEIVRNLGRYVQRYQDVCLQDGECKEGIVRKNCTNNIFVFRESNEIKVYKEENCVFINAPYSEQVIASDRIIFKLLGIQQ